MRVILVAIGCLVAGGSLGVWAGRELFGHQIFASFDLAPGAVIGVVVDNDTDRPTMITDGDQELDFQTPCVSRQLKRNDERSSDYQALLGRIPKSSHEDTYFEGSRAVSMSFECLGVNYRLTFGENGRIRSVSIDNF